MIKASFKNIGPIREAELELGDLTIIAGQNNTGKTYLVYTLYGFLKMLTNTNSQNIRSSSESGAFIQKIRGIIEALKETGRAQLGYEEFTKIKNHLIRKMAAHFSAELHSEVFNSPNGEFKNSSFNITQKGENNTPKCEYQVTTGAGDINLKISSENNNCIFELQERENNKIEETMFVRMVSVLIYLTTQDHFPQPFILSAERFGISLFYKELDFTKNRLVEQLQKLSDKPKNFNPHSLLEKGSARYALPIKDNIDFTRDLARIQIQNGNLPLDNNHHSVKRMMDGYYKVKSDEIRFISNRRGANRFDVPLHLSSSSARGVSDMYFYLKHVAQPGQILIIDEPESHLSPTNQVLMARLLVFCVNSGLKVMITTHSDYLIKEINNLIMLNNDFKEKDSFIRSRKNDYTAEDHLDHKVVKAYICQDGELTPCTTDATGIDMPVFDKAIDSINKISNQLTWLTTNKGTEND